MWKNTCCFLGHRTIKETEELKERLYEIVERLIVENLVDTFLFGSKSRFNSLCLSIVTKIKEKYPHIKRVYVRAEFPYINEEYKSYLLKSYEDTYYPEQIIGSGKAVYLKRNQEMINKSFYCIFYFNEECFPKNRRSGTKAALDYAIKKRREIFTMS